MLIPFFNVKERKYIRFKFLYQQKNMEEKKIADKIWKNIIIAGILMIYFIGVNVLQKTLNQDYVVLTLKVSSMIIMFISILIFEIAYKKDNGIIAITGIEILIVALHTLSILHVVQARKFDFNIYILTSSYLFAIYYVLKSIIIYTNEKRKYLKSLSDIKEIVTNEPIKKEAKKRCKKKN